MFNQKYKETKHYQPNKKQARDSGKPCFLHHSGIPISLLRCIIVITQAHLGEFRKRIVCLL